MGFRRIHKLYKKDGLDGLIFRFLKFLNFKIDYLNIREKNKYDLDQRIIKLSKNKIMDGLYKDTFLIGNNDWSVNDFSSKLLGVYEEQIQKKILEIKQENDLEYLVNFGASDGFHILGLLKKNIFKKGLAFEISANERTILKKNVDSNCLQEKIDVFGKANFHDVINTLNPEKLSKTLFLIDIEGDEFNIFTNEYAKKLEKSFFIIENHEFLLRDYQIKIDFDNLLKKFFKIELIKNEGRNPYAFDFIKDLTDDERWLMMSEQRPCEMNWIYLKPKEI